MLCMALKMKQKHVWDLLPLSGVSQMVASWLLHLSSKKVFVRLYKFVIKRGLFEDMQ